MSKRLRCAIYTRKSTDEGLEQSFNSLDAQREACAAYILSQAGEGWSPLKDIYDDGGFSGGTMERPALKRLLVEVEAGRVDVIVVYKVDRLTRSLADFARIVEILDSAKASFVSVTQAFNTTTSMGRLTLNVLLSFAQFEREVTGERIRDKIAASKAKGMWMGGNPPLGYDVCNRALIVNAAEAETVRAIFTRYLTAPNVFALRDGLARDGVTSKRWLTKAGREVGGRGFTHGALYHILSSRLYLGDIVHRDKIYPGQHDAIIAPDLFAAVQDQLADRAPRLAKLRSRGRTAPLLGKLFDDAGHPMTSAHANKKGRRYFYYVSTAMNAGKAAGSIARASALRLEQLVVDLVTPLLAATWQADAPASVRVFAAVQRAVLTARSIKIELAEDAVGIAQAEGLESAKGVWRIEAPHHLQAPSNTRGVLASGTASSDARIDRALVRAVALARRWAHMMADGEIASIEALAEREQVSAIYAGQLLPLAYLAPDLTGVILDGRQPPSLTLAKLLAAPLPVAFADQRRHFAQFA